MRAAVASLPQSEQLQRPGVRMVPKQVGLRRVAELEFEREGEPQDNEANRNSRTCFAARSARRHDCRRDVGPADSCIRS
jgi:hypothetical protein